MFKTINNMKVRDEKGFTLVELLIVIAIIAILAAIAIPQFSEYRKRGIEATMAADGKNAATAIEAGFADAQSYISFNLAATSAGPTKLVVVPTSGSTVTLGVSSGNVMDVDATASTYTVKVINANARSGKTTFTVANDGTTNSY